MSRVLVANTCIVSGAVVATNIELHGQKTLWVCVTCQVPLCKVKRYDGKSCFDLFHEAKELFNPCCVTAQEGLLVRTPRTGKQREPPTKGLAVARATSVAENVAEEGESSDDGIPNEHNNGSNDVNEL